MRTIELRFLDTKPGARTGVTWGAPMPSGELQAGDTAHLRRADGGALPTQTWPLAFWPDGSIKWLGCAAVVGPDDGESFSLVAGPGPAPATPLRITQPGIEIIRVVETGTMTVEVGDRGRYLIQEIARDGRLAAGGAELVCLLERRRQDGRLEVREREPFAGIVEQAAVEQGGPVRGVVRLTGRYRGEQSGRLWLPFTVRLVFYAGCDTVELVHSFVFDGDAERDFIAGLGLRVHVPLQDGAHNRHIRIVGDESAGVWSEPVRILPYAGHAATAEQLVQACGEPVPAPARGGMLPVWNDVQLLQDSCDHAQVRKRQDAGCCWITAEHCRRAPGILSLSEPAGGLAVGLRDFWQSHPACIEATGAGGAEATVAAWWWAPQAEPMDLRHYGHRDYRDVYEARNPDPALYSSPLGIARTSQLMLWTLPAGSRAEDLRLRSEQVQRPPLLAASPRHHHACGAFGPVWAPVDRGTPDLAALEDELAGQIGYLLEERETWRWYGFWHYGDFMHTYDPQRHCWYYDQGGRAWQNTELAADIWPWYAFLRSGDARLFRFAEAMTRHVSEVDVFHLGPWTGQGSRHNVVHWGCPCKEPRASQAGAKRFYHYLTADERCRDLLDEVAAHADQFNATNVPTDRVMARIGPTWVAWAANWFCAWERTRDPRWLERIRTGLRGILAAPYRLMQGDPFDYDRATGAMRHAGDIPFPSNRLAFSMGGAEALLEMEPHLGVEGLREALLEFAREHLRDPRRRETWPEAMRLRVGMIWGYTRLIAWAGRTTGDAAMQRRAAEILVEGDQDPGEGRTGLPVTWQTTTRPMAGETHREGLGSTNLAAVGGLNIIACLALVPKELEAAWQRRWRAAEATGRGTAMTAHTGNAVWSGRSRFHANVERRTVDRPAWWLGDPLPESVERLCRFYGVDNHKELKTRLDDDVWSVNIPFHCPPSNHIACAFQWAKEQGYNERTLTAPGFFEGIRDPARVNEFPWPDPLACMDAGEIRAAFADVPADKAALGLLWSCHLQDAWAAFGMEDALVCMLESPAMFRAVTERIVAFYLKANAFVYEAAGDRLDAVLIGNDVGCQTGLMLSPDLVREFMLPGTRAMIEQAHAHGVKVIHHSCGSIRPVIADIAAAGADAIHPVQALATGMAAEELAAEFGGRASFCGGLDVQQLMAHGTPADVRRRVAELRRLFPTGLIISPSHEALLPDVPPENVDAMRKAMRG